MNRKLIDEYVEFARVCLTEYKGLATIWNTFNEINVPLMLCKMAHKTTADLQRGYEEIHNQLVASAKVVQRLIRSTRTTKSAACVQDSLPIRIPAIPTTS